MKALLLTLCALATLCQLCSEQTLINFDRDGRQFTRVDNHGNAIDAHDGKISLFAGTYYLYGTSYNCGFEWGNKSAPFCGFKVYASTDLQHWTDKGLLFDAQSNVWQMRCDGKTYGCFRPHVVFNKKTQRYVLWINVYDNRVGYRVFTSTTPIGPFKEEREPILTINSDMPIAGLNNGDEDVFVDHDGVAYLAYTDWRTKGSIAIEKLAGDYLTGTGSVVRSVTSGRTEAPALFRRNDVYYLLYSDPNCGYCSGTGASYRTSRSPLGSWSEGTKISTDSCGGQPSFVSELSVNGETIYLFGVDLWNHGAKNEAQANFYWAPLSFAGDGSIQQVSCRQTLSPASAGSTTLSRDADAKAASIVKTRCDIGQTIARAQVLTTSKAGVLDELEMPMFRAGYPDAALSIAIYKLDRAHKPSSKALWSVSQPAASLPWGATTVKLLPETAVNRGKQYLLVMKSKTTTGCYGYAYADMPTGGEDAEVSKDGGRTFAQEANTSIKVHVHIR